MIFLGQGFCSGKHSLDYTVTNVSEINNVLIQNGIFTDLFMTKNTTYTYSLSIDGTWDFDTVMYAKFDGNLHAGNIEFVANQVSMLRIKRRKQGTYDWTTLYEVPILTTDDFNFERFDNFARSGTKYEYAVIPIIGGIESGLIINSVESNFEGLFIIEKDRAFGTELEVDVSADKNAPYSIVNTINRKYPYYVKNGNNNYYSGTATGLFIEKVNGDYEVNPQYDWERSHSIMEFLSDGQAKILKNDDGRMWMVGIIGNPSERSEEIQNKKIISFDWVEIGDCESGHELYNNGFIDVDYEGV
jgi:hypothetical protein